jgi:hypothetical protein
MTQPHTGRLAGVVRPAGAVRPAGRRNDSGTVILMLDPCPNDTWRVRG